MTVDEMDRRCDQCGAKARIFAILPNGGILGYCGHHGQANEHALIHDRAIIADCREVIPA